MSRRASVIAALLAAGCGSSPAVVDVSASTGGEMSVEENTNAEAPPLPPGQEAAPPVAGGGAWPGRSGTGRSAEDAVSACGPGDSYAFVAGEFQCPEGGNPLGGDPSAGQQSRVGNVGANSTGHIIDLYRVPCRSGPVDVFVDMYGCPEMRSLFGE